MRDKGHCVLNFQREPGLLGFWEGVDGDEDEEQEQEKEKGRGEAEGHFPQPTILSDTEMRFPSGRVIESRHATGGPTRTKARKAARKWEDLAGASASASTTTTTTMTRTTKALPQASATSSENTQDPTPPFPSHQQLALRRHEAETSLTGVSPQQRRALVTATKKAQRSEAVGRRAREWVYARGGNAQEFDQLNNRGKWGKQNHKLLPR
jgi:pre-60S factor REI1